MREYVMVSTLSKVEGTIGIEIVGENVALRILMGSRNVVREQSLRDRIVQVKGMRI